MLKAYYERSTPWPWDKEKKLENFFAYSSEGTPAGSIFYICWPVDKSANKAAETMATTESAEALSVDSLTLLGYDYAVCSTSTVDPVLVKLR